MLPQSRYLMGFLCVAIGCSVALLPVSAETAKTRANGTPEWASAAWPEHRSNISNWPAQVSQVNDLISAAEPDARADLPTISELLTEPFGVIAPAALLGNWRCRSLQAGSLGVFVYPYFKCAIRVDGKHLEFAKLSGSQRSSGRLYADSEKRWIYLGGASVNEDPSVAYSQLKRPGPSSEPLESDVYGVLQQRAPNHLVLLINPDGESYEVYELRR